MWAVGDTICEVASERYTTIQVNLQLDAFCLFVHYSALHCIAHLHTAMHCIALYYSVLLRLALSWWKRQEWLEEAGHLAPSSGGK